MSWPSLGVIKGALSGITAVLKTENGDPFAGFVSDLPWIFWDRRGCVVCERCETAEVDPDPPGSMGKNGMPEPLFSRNTNAYATFLASQTLHPFYKEHASCVKKEEVQ